VLDATVNTGSLKDADQDGKLAVAVDLAQVDDLLLVDFANDDPRQLHLDLHGTHPQQPFTLEN
jgi:hypothetical protein